MSSTHNRYPFDDRTVLVTGGGSGIGAAIVRAFAANGANVVVTGRRADALAQTLAGLDPARVLAVPGDVTVRADVRAAVTAALDRFGRLDVAVPNAGLGLGGPIEDLGDDDWAAVRGTNLDAFVITAQETLPHLVATGGSLVAVSSVSGLGGDWGQAAYNATKHAVNGFVRSLALDYGAKGVRINAVAPSFTLTPMNAAVGTDEASLAPFVNRIALGRPGTPQDMAAPVLWLASPDAAYVTGVILPVDGGTSAATGQPHL
ncbi:SDR family NAD(P)-dependent oxidoreductase [Pseudonocardia alni]|uniref:SDR family NAD(P)-dependent oxidoreductase n=1 Tax=Pseudonocardia alni TaxID=33907 RepID=UPI0033EC7CB1